MVYAPVRIALFIGAFLLMHGAMQAQGCRDTMLIDNTRQVVQCGLDTTGHWWAITQASTQLVTLYVDGAPYGPFHEVRPPVFSADGSFWATICVQFGRWGIVTPKGIREHEATFIDHVVFPYASAVPWYVVNNSGVVTLTDGDRSYQVVGDLMSVRFEQTGLLAYYVVKRGNQQALVRNGADVVTTEGITLAGVWADGRPVTSRYNGTNYSVLIGDDEILTGASTVRDLQVNRFGTVCAFVAAQAGAPAVAWMMTDDYIQPWKGPPMEAVRDVVLSPCCDLLAVLARKPNQAPVVFFNAADYPAGAITTPPAFSFDGAQMVYGGSDGEDFVSVNGKMIRLKGGGVAKTSPLLISPTGSTVAWVSATTLAVYDFDREFMALGKMCDTMYGAIYNRHTREYWALGDYGGRLFLLRCPAR